MASSKAFPFLRLPRELRDMIYCRSLTTGNDEPVCFGAPGRWININLIYASHQIYDETAEILYKKNMFTLDGVTFDSVGFLNVFIRESLGRRLLQMIRTWEFRIGCLAGTEELYGDANALKFPMWPIQEFKNYHQILVQVLNCIMDRQPDSPVLLKIEVENRLSNSVEESAMCRKAVWAIRSSARPGIDVEILPHGSTNDDNKRLSSCIQNEYTRQCLQWGLSPRCES